MILIKPLSWWRKLFNILSHSDFRAALIRDGVAASTEHRYILTSKAFASIIDIGANRGQFSLAAFHFCPTAEIFSFEPLSKPCSVFRRIFKNSPRIRLFQTAIGLEDKESLMHVSGRDDSSSLLPIAETQLTIFPGTQQAGVEQVRVARLSTLLAVEEIRSPALLKIDVQGFELIVIQGLLEYISLFDSIYVECSFIELYKGQALANNVIDLLHANSFKLSGIYNETYDRDGRSIQADFYFSRTN